MRTDKNKIRYRKFFEYYLEATAKNEFDKTKAAEISGYSLAYVKDLFRSLKHYGEGTSLDITIDGDEVRIHRVWPPRGERGEIG